MIRLLIADDDVSIREALVTAMKLYNTDICIVGVAENGKEAVEMYTSKRPDLVIMDVQMPVMNGILALMNIKMVDKNAKVIMITAGYTDIIKNSLDTLGATAVIKKPFDFKEFTENIKKFKG